MGSWIREFWGVGIVDRYYGVVEFDCPLAQVALARGRKSGVRRECKDIPTIPKKRCEKLIKRNCQKRHKDKD